MEDYQKKAREAQVAFHKQEVEEGPHRDPPMPPEQVEIHREQLRIHAGMLAVENLADEHRRTMLDLGRSLLYNEVKGPDND